MRGEEWGKSIVPRHDAYWRNEDNMAEGNPMLALERGEKVQLPPAIWFQARGDDVHDYKDAESDFPGNEPQRFVANYRKAGGEIELDYIEMERHTGPHAGSVANWRRLRRHGEIRRRARQSLGRGVRSPKSRHAPRSLLTRGRCESRARRHRNRGRDANHLPRGTGPIELE